MNGQFRWKQRLTSGIAVCAGVWIAAGFATGSSSAGTEPPSYPPPPPLPPVPTRSMDHMISPNQCDLKSPNLSEQICNADIGLEKKRLAYWSSNRDRNIITADMYLKLRLIAEKRLDNDYSTLRMLHEGRHGSSSTAEPHKSNFILSPDSDSFSSNPVWSGVQSLTTPYQPSVGKEAFDAIHGTLVVPNIAIPNTIISPAYPNGSCDGTSTLTYEQSWWIGVGGQGEDLYQTGVRGVAQCQPGTTHVYVTYYGWAELYPLQPQEHDFPSLTNRIQAGDTIVLQVSTNYTYPGNEAGTMTTTLHDSTQNIGSGQYTVTDSSQNPPTDEVEAVAERIQSNGDYFYAMPATSNTGTLFTLTHWSLDYEVFGPNAGSNSVDEGIDFSNYSSGACSQNNTFCVTTQTLDMENNGCDSALGASTGNFAAGYAYDYIGVPPPALCYTPGAT